MSNQYNDVLERKALIFNVQKYNTYDGPGVRTLIFFKGCPLRCKWCANPEGLEGRMQIMFKEMNCVHCGACAAVCPVGIHQMVDGGTRHVINRHIQCIGCHQCEKACFKNALTVVGEQKTISEMVDIVEEDRMFYEVSGGGLTVGGGECTAQPEALLALLMATKEQNMSTCIETSGYTSMENILKIAPYVDTFLYDVKHMDPKRHIELTGVNNERILENLEALLRGGYRVKIRMPLLKNVNDSAEEIRAVVDFLEPYKDYKNFLGIDLLPYHKLGVGKYNQLDMEYPVKEDPSLSEEDLNRIEGMIKARQFAVTLVRH